MSILISASSSSILRVSSCNGMNVHALLHSDWVLVTNHPKSVPKHCEPFKFYLRYYVQVPAYFILKQETIKILMPTSPYKFKCKKKYLDFLLVFKSFLELSPYSPTVATRRKDWGRDIQMVDRGYHFISKILYFLNTLMECLTIQISPPHTHKYYECNYQHHCIVFALKMHW